MSARTFHKVLESLALGLTLGGVLVVWTSWKTTLGTDHVSVPLFGLGLLLAGVGAIASFCLFCIPSGHFERGR